MDNSIAQIQEALQQNIPITISGRFPEATFDLTVAAVDKNEVLAYYKNIPFRFDLEAWMVDEMLRQIS